MTIPRGELQSLVVLQRVLLTVIEAFPVRFKTVSSYMDSLCSIGAVRKTDGLLHPFFMNRVLEIGKLREEMTQLVETLVPISHVPGDINPADKFKRC